jgi:hypothetical protein
MRPGATALLFTLLLMHAPAAPAADPSCAGARYTGDLTDLFVAPRELGADWDSVRETPSDPADEPDLAAAGVLATRTLHYTRKRAGGSEVCSLEIWGFASAEAARRGQAGMEPPGWRLARHANLLLMTRGVGFSREDGFHPGLLPECHRLADLAEARARERLGCADREE